MSHCEDIERRTPRNLLGEGPNRDAILDLLSPYDEYVSTHQEHLGQILPTNWGPRPPRPTGRPPTSVPLFSLMSLTDKEFGRTLGNLVSRF